MTGLVDSIVLRKLDSCVEYFAWAREGTSPVIDTTPFFVPTIFSQGENPAVYGGREADNY